MTTALPPLPTEPIPTPLRTVVLTCSEAGWETAGVLNRAPGVTVIAVVQTPPARARGVRARLRNVYRYHGLPGLARIPLNKLSALVARVRGAAAAARTPETASIPLLRFGNFHDPDCLAALGALSPDLAVVDGTYVLKEPVFMLPRFGSINLHCGKLPDYRGAPPAFWELYNGERQVGVTVHRVTAKLDEGPILQQQLFPLDPVPDGDAYAYVRHYWLDVLRPNGLRLLAEAASRIASGTAVARPQGATSAPTYRKPDFTTVRELRARVRARRRAGSAFA
jgi:methionyl-tRNA formyltransferase